jgi:O-antigen/teichoic acid export membrane protein
VPSKTEHPQNLHVKLFRGSVLLFSGKGVSQVCSFFRNVIVARTIGVENFGIAATFSITVSILDMLGGLSVDKLLIQAKDGNDEKFQATAHAVTALRGFCAGMLILAAAWPMARLFGVPQATWAFRFLALVPILRGLVHLDPQRAQREMNFRAAVGLEMAEQIIPTLLAWPLAIWLKDYSVVLWLLVIQCSVSALASFIIARRSYRWHWNARYVGRFFSFGWPLIINGFLIFGVFQGDRFLIATSGKIVGTHIYSLKDLGIYSVALSLTLTPMAALSNIGSSLMLPLFSRHQSERKEFLAQYATCSQVVAMVCGFFALPLILAGGWLVNAVYGPEYASVSAFIGWMAAAQAMRIARTTPTSAAMAYGDTRNALISNLVRSCALIGTLCVVAVGGPLKWVAAATFCGELMGLAVCLFRLEKDHQIPFLLGGKAIVIPLLGMAISGAISVYSPHIGPVLRLTLLAVILALFSASMMVSFPQLRSFARDLIERFRKRGSVTTDGAGPMIDPNHVADLPEAND